MKFRNDLHSREWFLNDPVSRKWIVQCTGCQEYGRKSGAPENIPKAKFFDNFHEMPINDIGLCEMCESRLKV